MAKSKNIGVLRQQMMDCIRPQDIQDIVAKLIGMAKDGDLGAIRLVLFHLVGDKPLLDATIVQNNVTVNGQLPLADKYQRTFCIHGVPDGQCAPCERAQREKLSQGKD